MRDLDIDAELPDAELSRMHKTGISLQGMLCRFPMMLLLVLRCYYFASTFDADIICPRHLPPRKHAMYIYVMYFNVETW